MTITSQSVNDFINDAINDCTAFDDVAVRFHARASHHRGRDELMMLRGVARTHGYCKGALLLALNEYRQAADGVEFTI